MKTKIKSVMLLATLIMLNQLKLNAQNWLLIGNSTATAASKLGTTNNIPLRLFTNNAERVHVNANVSGKVGYVGIGTTAPAQRLHVVGNGLFTGNLGIGVTTPTQKLHVAGNGIFTGNLGIGVTSPSSALDVVGNGLFTGFITASGVYGYSSGVTAGVTASSNTGKGISAYSNSSYGVYSTSGYIALFGDGYDYGVYGYSAVNDGVYGNGGYAGVNGLGTTYGVKGFSPGGYGVYGSSNNYEAGHFESAGHHGIWARTSSTMAGVYAGVFEGNVYTFGTYSSSDRILKKNIQDVENAMSIISRLKPKNYEFRDDAEFANMALPRGIHFGLIAQEVEEVIPEIVALAPEELGAPSVQSVSADGDRNENVKRKNYIPATKAINYTELIPIIIKAMQEQQNEITELKAENKQIKQDMQRCCLNHTTGSVLDKLQQTKGEHPSIEQNAPNPFTEQTVIRYYLPAGSTAVLKMMALDGKEMYSTPVTKTGAGAITISASTLSAGTYTYTLVVNGKAIESRIMILSE